MSFTVLGAGVAGLCAATCLAERGAEVLVIDPQIDQPASALAGGMLAPYCEGESAPEQVVQAGLRAVEWWGERVGGVERRGTLVIAPARDQAELTRFAKATRGHAEVDPGPLEVDLQGRFSRGLFYHEEAHLDPLRALAELRAHAAARGVRFVDEAAHRGQVIDCTGWAARHGLNDLRAVRGEMLLVAAPQVNLSRTVRLLHPRFPCYIVPRGAGVYMIGATMVESDDDSPISARALVELLSAAYTVHPGFAEARVLETGVGLRPAFADNIPAIRHSGDRIYLNGMYRHGYLMAPFLAEQLAEDLTGGLRHAG